MVVARVWCVVMVWCGEKLVVWYYGDSDGVVEEREGMGGSSLVGVCEVERSGSSNIYVT